MLFFFAMECKFQCTKNFGTPKRELRSQLSEFTSLTVLKAENVTELSKFGWFPLLTLAACLKRFAAAHTHRHFVRSDTISACLTIRGGLQNEGSLTELHGIVIIHQINLNSTNGMIQLLITTSVYENETGKTTWKQHRNG